MRVAVVVLGALAAYAVVCWVAAFVWNAVRHAARLLAAWAVRTADARRRWRRFLAEYGLEFAAPQYTWPAPARSRASARRLPWGGVR